MMKREILTFEEMNRYIPYIIIRIVKYHPMINEENIAKMIKKYYIVDETVFNRKYNTIVKELIDNHWLIAVINHNEKHYFVTKYGKKKYSQKTLHLSNREIDILYVMDF